MVAAIFTDKMRVANAVIDGDVILPTVPVDLAQRTRLAVSGERRAHLAGECTAGSAECSGRCVRPLDQVPDSPSKSIARG